VPGPQELLVIAVVALLVFGPDRLPEVMRNVARFIAKFREHSQRSIEELKRAAELDELNRELGSLGREAREAAGMVEREVSGVGRQASGAVRDAAGQLRGAGSGSGDDAGLGGPPPMDPEAT
jgi:sec-independent protein translocase protein TatB